LSCLLGTEKANWRGRAVALGTRFGKGHALSFAILAAVGQCRRRRVLSQLRRRVILAPALSIANSRPGAPACSRAKRRCGAISYHANKPQHLNPC
jgi:hypothetical protein